MAKPRLGSGGRFKAMVRSGMSPALVAWIGRKKFGKAKMQRMAAAGRKRKAPAFKFAGAKKRK